MAPGSLNDKLSEIYEIIAKLSERIHELENPADLKVIKPCNHFGDLLTALQAIKKIALVTRDSGSQLAGNELDAVLRIAESALGAKQGCSCPRWKYTFSPGET